MQKETIDVLKNAAAINQGILIVEGNQIRTMSVMKNVFLTANVPDTFDKEFAVYDLNELLSTLSLFDKPEVTYKTDHILVASGKSKIKYYYSAPSVVVSPPKDKTITITGDFTFQLAESVLSQLIKAAAIMKMDTVEITKDGLRAFNRKNGGNQYDVKFETTKGDLDEPKMLTIELLKLLPRDYTVTIGDRAAKFNSIDGDLEYIVTYASKDD
jgi:hypothetical protein